MRSQLPVDHDPAPRDAESWRDPQLSPTERAEALIPLMSLEEKIAQLVGVCNPSGRRLRSLVRIDRTAAIPRTTREASG